MAIHCDICGTILLSAMENEGSFPAPKDFVSRSPNSKNRIDDTCTYCANKIKNKLNNLVLDAVSEVVNNIRSNI